MPAVVPIVVSAAAAGTVASVVAGASFFAVAGSVLVSGLVSLAFATKPSTPSFSTIENGNNIQFRQPITFRDTVYGEVRKSGPVVFIGTTESNKFLHLVIALASHEVEQIGEIIVNDKSVPEDALDGSGNVTSGFYSGKLRIQKALGTDTQTALPDLISENSELDSNFRLQGIAYIYVRLEKDRDIYASGIPNISAWIKGKKILDTRDSTTKWTNNIALISRDYLVDADLGLGADASSIDITQLNSSANACEERIPFATSQFKALSTNSGSDIITLDGDYLELSTGDEVSLSGVGIPTPLAAETPYFVIIKQRKETPRIQLAATFEDALSGTQINITSGGSNYFVTKDAEKRYTGGGVLQTDSEFGENFKEILTGMAGQANYTGGAWFLLAGVFQTATISFNESDLVGSINVQTKQSERDRFNRVQGTYVGQINQGNPSDYPVYINSTFEAEDGKVLLREGLDLPFTQTPAASQRIAKLQLERLRQEIVFEANFKLTAFKVQVGNNFFFNFERFGWENKLFEVIEWRLSFANQDGVEVPVIRMTCRENASAVYDWNNGEQTTVDPAPNTTLPDPFTVPPVSGFALDSLLIDTQGGDKTFQVVASWAVSSNQFVAEGGFYEIEFKRTTESIFRSAAKIDGDTSEREIHQLQPDVGYDIRIRAFNFLNAAGPFTTIENFVVGDTTVGSTEDWENETIAARDGQDWETDALPSEDFEA